MSVGIKNEQTDSILARQIGKQQEKRADSIEKLASGEIFTRGDPRPAERAVSEQMEFKLRSLASSRRNVNDAVSMLQTAESALSDLNAITLRMKELSITASNTTISNRERRFLLIEHEALRSEMDRIAKSTEFNGIPILDGNSERSPEQLHFRVDGSFLGDDNEVDPDNDINLIRFNGLKNIVATPDALGIATATDLVFDSSIEDGIELEPVQEMLLPTENGFSTSYDQALNSLATQRALFGSMQSRLQRTNDYLDVYQENIAAAKSKITDTDYAREVARVAETNILLHASSGLLAQSGFNGSLAMQLINSLSR